MVQVLRSVARVQCVLYSDMQERVATAIVALIGNRLGSVGVA